MQQDHNTPSKIQPVILAVALAILPVLALFDYLHNPNRNTHPNFDTARQAVIATIKSLPVRTPAPSPTPGGTPPPAAGAQPLKEVTTDDKYSDTKLTAKAGVPIAFTITNNGKALHNWHVLDTKDVTGQDIKTDLIDPGKSETITFTISKPGTYHFQCDVHPTEMIGTLTVN